ncbi:MAG: hypothetical protein ABFS17_12425 [Chloroflexota bacterium]
MDKKLSLVIVWVGLIAAAAYTSNAMIGIFGQIVEALFSTLAGDFSALFSNYGVLFTTILGIGLIFLIVSAWLNIVSYTFDITDVIFEVEEDVEDSTYPAAAVRYMAFTWGLFFVLFLILPMVI